MSHKSVFHLYLGEKQAYETSYLMIVDAKPDSIFDKTQLLAGTADLSGGWFRYAFQFQCLPSERVAWIEQQTIGRSL